jgi:hypothetical protein
MVLRSGEICFSKFLMGYKQKVDCEENVMRLKNAKTKKAIIGL